MDLQATKIKLIAMIINCEEIIILNKIQTLLEEPNHKSSKKIEINPQKMLPFNAEVKTHFWAEIKQDIFK